MAKSKETSSADKLFYNKKFAILFSLIASVIFWMVITATESPTAENSISGLSISVPTENSVASELGLDVIGDISNLKAAVTVKGPAYVISALGEKDLAVTASLSNVTNAGTYELELRANKQAGSLNGEFEIASISPATITVTFDYIDTKQFTVTPVAVGASAVEGLVAENPVVSDSNNATLSFKGPRKEIEKIDRVVATAEVNSVLNATASFDATLKVYNAAGEELDTSVYTITTADGAGAPHLKISVPISKTKTVPLVAAFTNAPGVFSSSAVQYSLSERQIDVIGPPETVDTITQIKLSEIDFDKISNTSTSFTATPVLPDGVKSVDNIESVTVTVQGLEDYMTKTVTVKDINYAASGSNQTAKLSRSIRNVKICGPRSVLNKLTSNDFYAEIEISGKTNGEHTVSARIKCRKSNAVWQVGTYNATVTIS